VDVVFAYPNPKVCGRSKCFAATSTRPKRTRSYGA